MKHKLPILLVIGVFLFVQLALAISWVEDTNVFSGIDVGDFSSAALADLDNDNDLDLTIGELGGALYYYENTGTVLSSAWTVDNTMFSGIDVGDTSAPVFADLDNDNDLDLIIGEDKGIILYYINNGSISSPVWVENTTLFSGIDVGFTSTPVFADLDNDNDLDLIIGESDGNLNYYENTGSVSSPAWTVDNTMFSGIDVGDQSVPTFADLDNDNDLDLIIGELDGVLNYYENTGSVSSPAWTIDNTMFSGIDVGGVSNPVLADLDNDTDLDLIIGELDGILNYYENNGTVTCTDSDGDSYSVEGGGCGVVDCDDDNASINPGATEICNGVDDDCDTLIDTADGGYVPPSCGLGVCEGTLTCSGGELGGCSTFGNDAGVCSSCGFDGTIIYDETQDNDCGLCEECSAISACSNQSNGIDVKAECSSGDCASGFCNGAGTCDIYPITTECRASAGDCDTADFCDGSNIVCPADAKSTAQCRAAAGDCDLAETCDGVNDDCPADAFRASGYECRASAGTCDSAETCTGSNAACPSDSKSTAECRASTGDCDLAETCDGVNDVCPADAKSSSGTLCGSTRDCPSDTCGGTNNYFGLFYPDDGQDTCDGSGNCDTYSCSLENSYCCDNDNADGINGLNCNAECDQDSDCDDSNILTSDSCNLATCGCENNPVGNCLSNDDCGFCEKCDSITGNCIPQSNTEDLKNECPAGYCGYGSCNGAGGCDYEPKTNLCRTSFGPCDVKEYCTGTSEQCPADAVASPKTICKQSAGECDAPEYCTGSDKDCPSEDVKSPIGTLCGSTRNCPDDSCGSTNNYFGFFYPDDGHDTCDGSGNCDTYSCNLETSYCCDNDPNDGINGLNCNAECDQDSDCDDSNILTSDSCNLATCGCENNPVGNCLSNDDCGFCEKCDSITGNCIPQSNTEDLKNECSSGDCASGFCNGAGACNYEPSSKICRALIGVCDDTEFCTGSSAECPPDSKSTGMCKASRGECDIAEYCNGINNSCPEDIYVPVGTQCGQFRDCPESSCTGVNNYYAKIYPQDSYDSCDRNGNCIEYSCQIKGTSCRDNDINDKTIELACGAPCDDHIDCDDQNLYTIDECNVGCSCEYRPVTQINGDADANGKIDIFDLLEILRILGKTRTPTIDSDTDNNGKTDIFDLLEFLRMLRDRSTRLSSAEAEEMKTEVDTMSVPSQTKQMVIDMIN